MSRREPLILTRRDDLLALPTDGTAPPAVPPIRAILRWFAAALTYFRRNGEVVEYPPEHHRRILSRKMARSD